MHRRKKLKVVISRKKSYHAHFLIFPLLIFVFFLKFSSIPLLKGRQTLLLNSESVQVTKKLIVFQLSDFLAELKAYLLIYFPQIKLILSEKPQSYIFLEI